MDKEQMQQIIDEAWEGRDGLGPESTGSAKDAVEEALARLDSGTLRVAEKQDGHWRVNEWLKKAVLLSFRLNGAELVEGGPGGSSWPGAASWYDKVPLKFAGWGADDFAAAGFRVVPGAIVRHSAYIAPGAVLMPCFINVGAHIGEGTMVDTWSTVASCAQIGRNVHISGGVGIGGVLEPLQATPVIIEDGCFIGARSEVAEGVIVEEGAVISMGVFISASTPIIDRATGEITRGRVPAYAVVVPGTLPGKPLADGSPGPGLAAAVIVKRVDAGTRAKTSINEILRH